MNTQLDTYLNDLSPTRELSVLESEIAAAYVTNQLSTFNMIRLLAKLINERENKQNSNALATLFDALADIVGTKSTAVLEKEDNKHTLNNMTLHVIASDYEIELADEQHYAQKAAQVATVKTKS